jgi:putative ABC transport system permease protein
MLTESCLISFVGGVLGSVACIAFLMWKPMSLSTEGVTIDFLASPILVVWGLGLSLVVGLAAGAIPAWQAGRAEIVNSLR